MNKVSPASRNPWLDIYRFVFALVIALYHEVGHCHQLCPRGALAVYFFFLLSGYLAATSLERYKSSNEKSIGCAAFMGRKLLAVQPELLVTALLFSAVYLWHNHITVLGYPFLAMRSILSDVLLLRMTGIENTFGNGVAWYISSMMLCLVILFPIIRKHGSNIYLLVFGLLVIGWIKNTTGTLLPYFGTPMAGSFAGNYWALGALSIGAALPPASRRLANLAGSKLKCAACILLPATVLYCIHQGQCPESTPILHDNIAILAMCLMIALAAITAPTHRNPSRIGKICTFLGKLSLPFYLVHRSIILVLEHTNLGTWEYVTVYISLTMVVSALVMAAAGFIRAKISKYYL